MAADERQTQRDQATDFIHLAAIRDMAELAGMGSVRVDLWTMGVTLTPCGCMLLGLGPETGELDLGAVLGVIHPDDVEIVLRRLEQARLTGETPPFEARVGWPDGSEHTIRVSGVAERDERSGDVTALTGWMQDVTEQRSAEAALRESEDLFRSLFEHSLVGNALLSLDARFLRVNQAFCDLLGYRREEVEGRRAAELGLPGDDAYPPAYVRGLLDGSQREARARRRAAARDGTPRWVDVLASLRRDERGTPLSMMVSMVDVTEHVAALDEVRRLEATRDVAEQVAHVGSISLDLATQHAVWTPEVYRLFDVDPDTPPDLLAVLQSRVHPEDQQQAREDFAGMAAGEAVPALDHRVVHRDGSEHVLRREAKIERDEHGVPLRITGYLQDVTEQRRQEDRLRRFTEELEKEVARRTAQLEAANRELEAFVYSAAHDLRAPLRAIDGFSEMVAEDAAGLLPEEDREHLRRVRGAAQRMGSLIDHLMALSRATRQDLFIERVDVTRLACEVCAEVCGDSPERPLEVAIRPDLTADTDATVLRGILTNLVSNAWKFTGNHSTARIEIGASDADGERIYYVRDDGAGFDAQAATHLFGPFQRYHDPRDFPGDGIGLATVQRLVARLGGRVWAEAAVEEGATFFFTLGQPANRA